jgi:sialic acid synthase SpsE
VIKLPSGRRIGPGQPPFIIAEVGSNWRTLDDCKHSVVQAKQCGADAVKFQAFNHQALYGFDLYDEATHDVDLCGVTHTERKLRPCPHALPLEWLPELAEKAMAVGIEFMCTAFSPELIDAVDPHVSIHKVASSDCTHKRMLERLAKIGKPVLLSTGAHGANDIGAALSILKDTPTVLLYCVAAYPAQEIFLHVMADMAKAYARPVGYSDHSTDALIVPKAAIDLGACVLEKHVTFIDAKTPDSPHSLNADQFKRMVDTIRGNPARLTGPTLEEQDMVRRHNRRLIATRDIPAGDTLREHAWAPYQPCQAEDYYPANFGIYRSLKDESRAYHPFMIDEVNGKTAKRAIRAGDGIGPGDV